MKRPSKDLIAFWYRKAQDSGFDDIERGKDMNQYPASTMPAEHVSIDAFNDHDQEWEDNELETQSLTNADRAVFFRAAFHAANRLKDCPEKQFVLDWCDSGNLADTARDYGMTRKESRIILSGFLKAANLWMSKARGNFSDPGHEPGPVRVLSKSEIKRLRYKSPKQIKDSSE